MDKCGSQASINLIKFNEISLWLSMKVVAGKQYCEKNKNKTSHAYEVINFQPDFESKKKIHNEYAREVDWM